MTRRAPTTQAAETAALPVLALAVAVLAVAPAYPVALVGAVLLGFGNGAMDVAMNAIGVQVEAARRKPIMSFFHAFFSIGNFVGAGAVLLLLMAALRVGGALGAMWPVSGASVWIRMRPTCRCAACHRPVPPGPSPACWPPGTGSLSPSSPARRGASAPCV